MPISLIFRPLFDGVFLFFYAEILSKFIFFAFFATPMRPCDAVFVITTTEGQKQRERK